MANGVAEWFGLERPNFILDPRADAEFYAPRAEIDIFKLMEGLQVNLVTERPPKRFFWGRYGGGKTHTLLHLAKRMENLTPICPVYVECPSVPKKSTFHHLYHDGIMGSMGQDFIVKLFEDLIDSIGTVRHERLLQQLKEITGDEELSRAIASLLGAQADKKLSFWRYISGVNLPARDLADLGQTQSLADVIPSKLAETVICIGRVIKRIENKTLILILDEIDRLQYVTDEYGMSTYEEAFRRLVDENQRDLAILMGCSAHDIRYLPELFRGEGGPILSRIGAHNIIEIHEISPDSVDRFIKAILGHVVNRENAEQKVSELKRNIDETLEVDSFPFTKEAIEAIKATLRGAMTPREITQRMSDAAGKAFLMKRAVVTREIIGG